MAILLLYLIFFIILCILETLEKLSALKDKGIITDAEFKREKQKIMSNL